MNVFGWIMIIALALFGISILVIFTIPFVMSEIKSMSYKIEKAVEDKKADINKRSEARKNRDEIKRAKDFELANKKLNAKLQKVDKQIEIQQKKLALVKELKKVTSTKKEELKTIIPKDINIKSKKEIIKVDEDLAIPADTED